jgi:glycosyltransferase involved in cell wall biosynthesis
MNEDITVVITCFNYGAFLPDSTASVLAQEGGAPQVIVVDDGSTDRQTLAELERLPPSVELVRQPNSGVAAARNTGLRMVNTRYALALDADDKLTPDALLRLREPLERDPTLGFSYGVMRFFGSWEGDLKMPPYDPYRLLYRHNIGPTGLIRRELFEAVGGYDSSFTGYEDWEFWLQALARGWRGRRVEAVTLLHRRHGPSRHLGARPQYRAIFRQLRRKHAVLYDSESRRRLQAESDLSRAGRFIYRWWWGRRPLPARVELALQAALWSPKKA